MSTFRNFANQIAEQLHQCKDCQTSHNVAERWKIEDASQSAVTTLGYAEIKDKQKEAVLVFASGKDFFVSLPIGYGKSLCYACLPYQFNYLDSSPECVSSLVVVVTH